MTSTLFIAITEDYSENAKILSSWHCYQPSNTFQLENAELVNMQSLDIVFWLDFL